MIRLMRTRFAIEPGVSVPRNPAAVPSLVGGDAVLRRIRAAFALRPVWGLFALVTFLSPDSWQTINTLLPAAAYSVRGGAFRHMWLRLGYDPRDDPNSRILQAIDVKLTRAVAVRCPHFSKPQGVKSVSAKAVVAAGTRGGGGEEEEEEEAPA